MAGTVFINGTVVPVDPQRRIIEDGAVRVVGDRIAAVGPKSEVAVEPGDRIYKGMIVGENARDKDIPVNPCKTKHLTNMRSQGDGKGIQLEPALKMSLERALEYIGPDEYVEATPKNLRLRKKILDETQRKRAERGRVMKVAA